MTHNRQEPKVTVIMPTYNRGELLSKTLETILSQDFEALEMLVVDDGSLDNTESVIRDIQAGEPRLRYLPHSENRGVGLARETGLRSASGNYIAFADSDDPWLPGKLNAQVRVLDCYPEIDCLFGDFWNVDHVRGTEARGFSKTLRGMSHLQVLRLEPEVVLIKGGIETGILKADFIHPPTMLFRAGLLSKVGGYETSLKGAADHEFCWRAAVLGASFGYIEKPLVERHRYHSSQTANVEEAQLWMLECLRICHRTATKALRPDLQSHISNAEFRTWRNLIREYCNNGERGKVLQAYMKSLRHGFSLRTFTFFVIALGGSHAMSSALKLRARSLRVA